MVERQGYNTNTVKNDVRLFIEHLLAEGLEFDGDQVADRAVAYLGLIREWNAYASLVSMSDAKNGLEAHLLDSWALVPWIARNVQLEQVRYIDLGSGGGFPAIPICMILGELRAILVDRNEKKTVFLKKAVRRLELTNVSVENRSFEGQFDAGPLLITSRAIEKPQEVIPRIVSNMAPGDVYLCQSPTIEAMELPEACSVESIADYYSQSGIRRSGLHIVRLDAG